MMFRRPGLTAAELKIQKLMIYSADQPSWVALDILPGYLLPLKDALGRPPIAGSRCYGQVLLEGWHEDKTIFSKSCHLEIYLLIFRLHR